MARKRTVRKPETPALKPEAPVSNHERIALLAFSYWEQRGCMGGSPEEDWFRAEKEVVRQPDDLKQE